MKFINCKRGEHVVWYPPLSHEELLGAIPHVILCRELLDYCYDGMVVPYLKVTKEGSNLYTMLEYTVGDLCFTYNAEDIELAQQVIYNEHCCGSIRVGNTRICTDDIGKNTEDKLVRQAIIYLKETMDIIKEHDYKLLRKAIAELEGEEE